MSFYDHPDRQWDNARPASPQPVGEPSRLRGLSTALTVLFIVIAAVGTVAVMALVGRISYVDGVLDSGRIAPDRAEATDGVVILAIVLWFALFIAIAAVFIVWQCRHAQNARLLGADGGLTSTGWAVGGWFLPMANLFIPARNLYENGQHSDPNGRVPGWLVAWAVCFGIAFVVWVLSIPPRDEAEIDRLEQMQATDGLTLVAHLFYIAAAVLAIVMVRQLTARQESALAARTVQLGGPAAYASWPPTTPYTQASPTTPYAHDVPPARPAPPSPFAQPPSTPPAGTDREPGAPAPPPVPPQP